MLFSRRRQLFSWHVQLLRKIFQTSRVGNVVQPHDSHTPAYLCVRMLQCACDGIYERRRMKHSHTRREGHGRFPTCLQPCFPWWIGGGLRLGNKPSKKTLRIHGGVNRPHTLANSALQTTRERAQCVRVFAQFDWQFIWPVYKNNIRTRTGRKRRF